MQAIGTHQQFNDIFILNKIHPDIQMVINPNSIIIVAVIEKAIS